MWVPLVENREIDTPGADYFVRRHLEALFSRDPRIDTLVLGCTHYPLLLEKIRRHVPAGVRVCPQGERVAEALVDYLRRHPEMDERLSKNGKTEFFTTESPERFSENAAVFLGAPAPAEKIVLEK